MSSLSWVKNLVKKPDPPEMMDGGSTIKISPPATSSRKRLDPPEMMNGRLPSPTTVQDTTTMDHNLLVRWGGKMVNIFCVCICAGYLTKSSTTVLSPGTTLYTRHDEIGV